MRRAAAAAALVLAAAAARTAAAQEGGAAERPRALALAATLRTEFPLAVHRALDVDGDGRDDVLLIGRHGEVRVWRHGAEPASLPAESAGVLVLPEPERSVLAVADLLGTGGPPQLCVLSRRGLEAYPVGTDGAYGRAPVLVSKSASFGLRVGEPRFADVLRDVNGDGRPDLILPRGETCELWLWNPPPKAGEPPVLKSVGAFQVDVSRDRTTGSESLSDVLESGFRIPPLAFSDVNGDGRKDLLVEDGKLRAFHLAREDGTISAQPDVKVDLASFQDTTPEAEVRLGRTLAGGDEQRFDSADLNGDGIPDYVISHRRKVWVFLGGREGPQFHEPLKVLRVADDVSAMLVVPLGEKSCPDLLLLRVQVPTVATVLRGLVASWDVEVGAVGYENRGNGEFETTPRWKGEISLRLPAILGMLKDPDSLVRRFDQLATKFRRGFLWGDFDGDGRDDAAVVSSPTEGGERTLDVWLGLERGGASLAPDQSEIGSVFFGEEKVWDLERVLGWLGDYADRRFAKVTRGRAPALRLPLRKPTEAEFLGAHAANLDGAGATEIVVVSLDESGRGVVDVWR